MAEVEVFIADMSRCCEMLRAYNIRFRHRELHFLVCSDIEWKHFRIDLRRADRLLSLQAQRRLQQQFHSVRCGRSGL